MKRTAFLSLAKNKLFRLIASIGLTATLFSTLFVGSAAAATAKFTISPTSGSVTVGSSIVLTIQATANGSAFAVQSCVTYDSSKLQLTNTDYSADPLTNTTGSAPSTDCLDGEIQLGRYSTSPASGTFTVAALTFKALQSGTTASVGFDDAKSVIGNDTPSGSNSSTLTLVAIPAPTPTPTPTTPPATTTNPPATTTPSTTPKTAPKTNPSPTTPSSTPAITDTPRAESETTQAASPNVTESSSSSGTSSKPRSKKTSYLVIYIIGGGIAALLLAAGLLLKFVGSPFKRSSTNYVTPISPQNTDPTTDGLSRIQDPDIPQPSAIITPTETPNDPTKRPPA